MARTKHASIINLQLGCFLGAAYGDALGAGVEFYSPEKIRSAAGEYPIRHYISGGLGFKAGDITDDTDQAILIAEALAEHNELITKNDPEQYKSFYDTFGKKLVLWRSLCHDVGGQTSRGISAFQSGQQMVPEKTRASNGAVMRVYPIAMRFFNDPVRLVNFSDLATKITHPHPDAVACAIILNGIIAFILKNKELGIDINRKQAVVGGIKWILPYAEENSNVVSEHILSSLMTFEAPAESQIMALDCLQLAVAYFLKYDNAEDVVAHTASFGGDNDTHAAVAGALAGAWWGKGAFPLRWSSELKQYHQIINLAAAIARNADQG